MRTTRRTLPARNFASAVARTREKVGEKHSLREDAEGGWACEVQK